MSNQKKRRRGMLRVAAFTRDKYRCCICKIAVGETPPGQRKPCPYLDAHHITPRDQMPGGGYVLENVITLCDICHNMAEAWLNDPDAREPSLIKYTPTALYTLIGSTYQRAVMASENLL